MQDKIQSWRERLFAPNRSPYAGQQPIGRNIWGQAGAVDTHYPVTKPFSAPRDAAWVDRNGDTASISVSDTDYTLDHNTWSSILNQASKEQLEHIEQQLKDKGFFHVSELPANMRSKVPIDIQADTPVIQAPPMLKYDDTIKDNTTGDVMLLPPHIYHYEPVPDETYSLEYDSDGYYLPPYNPDAPHYEGNPTPRDYAGAMPPVGDAGREEQFDDYLSYSPPVNDAPVDGNARKTPFFLQKTTPELIPDVPYWIDYTGKHDRYSPTTQRNILNDLLALTRA